MTTERQQIMNLYCRIILLNSVDARRKALTEVPEHQREEVKKRVAEYFEMRTKRRIASEQARAAREADEKRRKTTYGG